MQLVPKVHIEVGTTTLTSGHQHASAADSARMIWLQTCETKRKEDILINLIHLCLRIFTVELSIFQQTLPVP